MAERVHVREIGERRQTVAADCPQGQRVGGDLATAQMVLLSAQSMPVAKIAEVTFTSRTGPGT
ncbi:hypothetical protein OG962_33145 [Streptomyces platensis]|nr:hypothetical protein OG962_33145 [Streptomyces platensis]